MPPEQTPQPNAPKPDAELKPIHTYQSDVEELMQQKDVSRATIALAESERRIRKEKAPEDERAESKIFKISNDIPFAPAVRPRLPHILIAAATLLALGGAGWGIYAFVTREPAPPVTERPATSAVTGVALQGAERRAGTIRAIQKTLRETSVTQNELRAIPVMSAGKPLGTPDFFAVLEARATPELIRALGTAPVLGVHGFKGGQPFLLLSVTSYDYAFAGMLAWEKTLLDDIGPLFGVSPRAILSDAGETTEEALGNAIVMKDVIIRNKDARAAFAPSGALVFLYSFIDKQTLILTTNEDTLKALIGKAGGGRLK